MKLDLITNINTIKALIQFREPSNFIPPKASITPSEYAPILKRGDQLEQTSFLEPELVYARWGLVPNEYSSLADADRFGLYQTRVESTMRSRTLSKIYPAQRCLIPMMALEMEQTAKLESLTPRLLAGIWTQFVRPLKRVQSFSILTTKNKLGRVAVMLEGEQAQRWLNPITSKRELRALVEGWWAISSFSVNLNLNTITDRAEPRQLESPVLHTNYGIDAHQVNETMNKRRLRFLPGDPVLNAKHVRGKVLEVQPDQVHDVLVRWEDGLELWHNSNGLHRQQPN